MDERGRLHLPLIAARQVSGVLGRLKSPPAGRARRLIEDWYEAAKQRLAGPVWTELDCSRQSMEWEEEAAAEEERRCRLQSAAGYHLGQSA